MDNFVNNPPELHNFNVIYIKGELYEFSLTVKKNKFKIKMTEILAKNDWKIVFQFSDLQKQQEILVNFKTELEFFDFLNLNITEANFHISKSSNHARIEFKLLEEAFHLDLVQIKEDFTQNEKIDITVDKMKGELCGNAIEEEKSNVDKKLKEIEGKIDKLIEELNYLNKLIGNMSLSENEDQSSDKNEDEEDEIVEENQMIEVVIHQKTDFDNYLNKNYPSWSDKNNYFSKDEDNFDNSFEIELNGLTSMVLTS